MQIYLCTHRQSNGGATDPVQWKAINQALRSSHEINETSARLLPPFLRRCQTYSQWRLVDAGTQWSEINEMKIGKHENQLEQRRQQKKTQLRNEIGSIARRAQSLVGGTGRRSLGHADPNCEIGESNKVIMLADNGVAIRCDAGPVGIWRNRSKLFEQVFPLPSSSRTYPSHL